MSTNKTMTFEEFTAELVAKFGENKIRFTEVGKHGWTSVEDILGKKPGGSAGPHWCDVSTVPRSANLVAKYDFNTSTATFF